MRVLASVSAVVVVSLVTSVGAQQANSPASVERVRLALETLQQQPGLISPTLPPWTAPAPTRLGILTIVPPQKNGEIVRLIVPVGDLVARAVHAVSSAQYRRAEKKAHQEVLRTLQSFQAQLPAR
jgi:hypothetical protein